MEAVALTVVCHGGRRPAHAVFLPGGCCRQPVPSWSGCPAPGPGEETRAAALAGRAACRGRRGGDRGLRVVGRARPGGPPVPGPACWPGSGRSAGRRGSPRSGARSPRPERGEEKAAHLVAALARGIGAVLGRVAVDAGSGEVAAVGELLTALPDLAGAVVTAGALRTRGGTARAITGRPAGWVMTAPAGRPAVCRQLEKLPCTAVGATWAVSTGRGRRGHQERREGRRGRVPHCRRPRRRSRRRGGLGRRPPGDRKPASPGPGVTYREDESPAGTGNAARVMASPRSVGRQPAAPGRPRQYRRRGPPPRPRPAAGAEAASHRVSGCAVSPAAGLPP
jgi:hypothetical protein